MQKNNKNNSEINATDTSIIQQQAETDQTQEITTSNEYYIGDTLNHEKWRFSVITFEEGKTYNSAFFPKDGEKYVTLEVFLENTSSEIFTYSFQFWKLVDQEGYEYDLEMLGDKRPSFAAGDLSPGKKKKGFVTFKCPQEAKNFELHFNPILAFDGESTYAIKLFK